MRSAGILFDMSSPSKTILPQQCNRRYVRTTDSSHDSPIYPNLYRNLIPPRPDTVWGADFTYRAPRPNRGHMTGMQRERRLRRLACPLL